MNPPPLDIVQALAETHRGRPGELLPLLHAVQDVLGYVPADAVPPIAAALNLSRAEVHGVVTYYHHFRTTAPGRHLLQLCRAESCKSRGADALIAHAERVFGCAIHTTRGDGAITLEPVYCLGLCAMSPAVMLDEVPHARMTVGKLEHMAAHIGAAS